MSPPRGLKRTPAQRAFVLAEVLIVVVILGILAAIIFPKFSAMDREARAKTQATNTRAVREMIQLHRHTQLYELGASGYPVQIEPDWFRGGDIPEHAWTTLPMNVDDAAAGDDVLFPLVKTYDDSEDNPVNAWYNTDNGHFCALVPAQATDEETLELFNIANACQLTDLGQTE